MAQINGYVSVPHGSYEEWFNATWGNGYDVDGSAGNQCWDFCALLWYQYGLTLVTKAGGGVAYQCWTISKNVNAQIPFIAIERKEDIKKGDVVVFNKGVNLTGHIAFANEDYHGSTLQIYGQHQGTNIGTHAPANLVTSNTALILGAFRNTNWEDKPTPTPSGEGKRHKYPWTVAFRHWR